MAVVTVPTGKRGFDPRYHAPRSRPSGVWEYAPEEVRSPRGLSGRVPGRPPKTFVHWLIWNLVPASAIPEGIPRERVVSAPEAVQGRNGFGSIGYRGPFPPPGAPHRYVLRVYALDSRLSLPPGSEMDDLVAAMEGHVLQSGEAAATRGG